MNLYTEEFDIKNHKHKFAVWAAGRAASVKDQRFSVESAKKLIDHINLQEYIDKPDGLPDNFDTIHDAWCKSLIEKSMEIFDKTNSPEKINYGVAAKLINVYLKTILVCGGYHEHEKVKKIHPPIDRLLLTELAKKDDSYLKKIWKKYAEKGWSKFDSADYQAVIRSVKDFVQLEALYTIESFWTGHQ